MDKSDEVNSEPKRRGRPKKDVTTPVGEYQIEAAKTQRDRKKGRTVVEKYWELCGAKLSLVKKMSSGTVHKTFVGSTTDKVHRAEITKFIAAKKAEGTLKIKV